MTFKDLGLADSLMQAVEAAGYSTPTQIQTMAIPPVLQGRDVLGCAQTGTGKTAAFALPTLQRLSAIGESRPKGKRPIRALVLCPTRELAVQIGRSFDIYGRHTGLRNAVIFGGVGQNPQVRALTTGIDIVVATPGRLLDLMQQGFVDLSRVEVLILDEADRMLDMGFIHDLRRIVGKVPPKRQTLLFSATMPANVQALVDQWLNDPVTVKVARVSSTAEKVVQSVFFIDKPHKLGLLMHWLKQIQWTRTLVFTRTKHGADKVVRQLVRAGIEAEAFHSNKSQNARQRVLARFKRPEPLVLVATDIAARGLDIDQISHVVNYDLPMEPENYVHRIGRTGRAGAAGVAISFCDREERGQLRAIEQLTRQTLTVEPHPVGLECPRGEVPSPSAPRSQGNSNSPRRGAANRTSGGRGGFGARGKTPGKRRAVSGRK